LVLLRYDVREEAGKRRGDLNDHVSDLHLAEGLPVFDGVSFGFEPPYHLQKAAAGWGREWELSWG